jgi:L-fucose isomerase
MASARQPKVGLVSVALAEERVDLAKRFASRARENLAEAGIALLGDGGVLVDGAHVLAATAAAKAEGADCLVYQTGTWVNAPDIVDAVQEARLPCVIWGEPEPASFSSVGANVVHGSLDELGLKHRLVYGFPEEAGVVREIGVFARAAMAMRTLEGSRFGLIGGRSIGMYPSTGDPIQVKRIFGIEIEHIDQFLMVEYARIADEDQVLRLYSQMKSEFGRIEVAHDVMNKSIRLAMAIRRIYLERNLDFAGVKCLEEVINGYASCCLGIALANDDGLVTACQSDMNAAIAMMVLHTLTGAPTIFADINHVDMKTGVARLVNCGTMPTRLADNRHSVDWNEQYEYMGRARGACPTFCCKAGAVTFGMLSRISGEYVMQIAGGEAFQRPREVFEEVRGAWPQAFIRLACNPGEFFQNVRSNHAVVGYGDVRDELVEFCRLIGIKPIVNG